MNNESLKSGAASEMDCAFPDTLMRIATEDEIIWARERFNELISGIRFTGSPSDSRILQLAKKPP